MVIKPHKLNIFSWKKSKQKIQPMNLRGLSLNYSSKKLENRVRLWS